MKGWIKLHRQVRDHWTWKDPVKFQWWLIMLLEVNFTPGKMMLGNQLVKVERGSSTNSLRRWAELFGCGTKATTNFFDLLESDEMISRKTLGKGKHSTTLINITNYEQFQTSEETLANTLTDTQRKHKGNVEGTQYKNEKKEKEFKEKKKREAVGPALDFLKNNFPEKFEEFKSDYGKQIEDKKKFAGDFNDTVISEKKNIDEALFGRLRKYARNWIENQEKYNSKEVGKERYKKVFDQDGFYTRVPIK